MSKKNENYIDDDNDDDFICPNCGDYKDGQYELCYNCWQEKLYQLKLEKEKQIETLPQIHCCLCNEFIYSVYLYEVFKDKPKAYYLSCMVMHYRHEHVKYYNNSVGYVSRFHDYDKLKEVANERAKRQILRKAKKWLKENGFIPSDFLELKGTTPETMKLAEKLLS